MKSNHPHAVLSLAAAAATGALVVMPLHAQVERPEEIRYPPLPPMEIPRPERVELSNGLIVYLLEDHELPLVTVQVSVRTGSRYEPDDKVGLASLTARVMRTGGMGARSGAEVDEFLEDRAVNLSNWIGTTQGSVRLSVLAEYVADALPVLADMLRRPRFEEDKLEEAKVQEKSAIARRNDSPGSIALREFRKLIYGSASPYARHTEHATIDAVTRDDLVAFHERFYHPNHTMIGVIGDFNRDEIMGLIEDQFGDWEAQEVMLQDDFEIQSADPSNVYYVEKTDLTQTNFRVGHLGTTVDDPDYFAVEVMNTVFGQGFASRLFNVIRSEKGLAYSIRGGIGAGYAYPGIFQVSGQTKLESTTETLRAIIEEIERMKEGTITEDELAYAKQSYLNSFIFNFDTPGEVVSRQMLYEYYGYPADFLERFRERVEAVTRADVRRVARRLLTPDRLIIMTVGDAARFDGPLSEFGHVVPIDISIPEGS